MFTSAVPRPSLQPVLMPNPFANKAGHGFDAYPHIAMVDRNLECHARDVVFDNGYSAQVMGQERASMDQGKQQETQAAQDATMAGMAGTQAGATAGGAVGAVGGGVVGWSIGMTSGGLIGLIVGMFLGLAIAKSNDHA